MSGLEREVATSNQTVTGPLHSKILGLLGWFVKGHPRIFWEDFINAAERSMLF
jgi:hypothetical protein